MKQIVLPAIIIFTSLSVFTFGAMTMNMSDDGSMSSCPFMDHDSVICPMGLFGHISLVQSIFRVIPKNFVLMIPIFLLAALAFFTTQKSDILTNKRRQYFYTARDNLSLLNKFLSALSDGIIQPKLYA